MNTLLRIAYFAVLYGLLSLASPAATCTFRMQARGSGNKGVLTVPAHQKTLNEPPRPMFAKVQKEKSRILDAPTLGYD